MKPDTTPFRRVNALLGGLAATHSRQLGAWVSTQIGKDTSPHLVPFSALQAMSTHPIVYLAERTISGVTRRPDLYYVRHPDKRVVKETEEWLWPLLPRVLASAARAYAYGSVPVIFNWGREDLRVQVPGEDGAERAETLTGHTHYVSAHELSPEEVTIETQDDRLRAVRVGERAYRADRAHVFRWDAEFGSWLGQSARRRAWRDYCLSMHVGVLQTQYLERSVDSPRVAFAPAGFQEIDGVQVSNSEHVNELLTALRGSGSVTFPSTRDQNGQRRYDLQSLDLPDRKDVWHQALNRYDGGILKAYLVPPSLAGVEDLAAAGARVLDGMLREFIQDLAQFAADNLTELVEVVHAANYDPAKVPPPEILAFEVPAAIRKLYLEVLRLVSASGREEAPADWVDVPALLDQLGVPLRTSPAPRIQTPRVGPGRPRDMTGERQERRESARTTKGEEATGAKGTGTGE
ncbi:MAG: hypothetical protein R3F62_30835 [Planctomycetota bacterium]